MFTETLFLDPLGLSIVSLLDMDESEEPFLRLADQSNLFLLFLFDVDWLSSLLSLLDALLISVECCVITIVFLNCSKNTYR